jgi:hypothetical protein
MADMVSKGRSVGLTGSLNPAAKLTEDQVRAIRSALHAGKTCAALSREYGVTDVLVGLIKRREKWRHV